jgi:hypothetical protein
MTTALLVIGVLGSSGIASAQDFGVYFGLGYPQHYRHHHWRHIYGYEPECRVVIRHHITRWGDRVTVRRRICD